MTELEELNDLESKKSAHKKVLDESNREIKGVLEFLHDHARYLNSNENEEQVNNEGVVEHPEDPFSNHHSKKSQPNHYTSAQREGKRTYIRRESSTYKKYTYGAVLAALEEVRQGKSALQVSKDFNIPTRTLYDKARKLGLTSKRRKMGTERENFLLYHKRLQNLWHWHPGFCSSLFGSNNSWDWLTLIGNKRQNKLF